MMPYNEKHERAQMLLLQLFAVTLIHWLCIGCSRGRDLAQKQAGNRQQCRCSSCCRSCHCGGGGGGAGTVIAAQVFTQRQMNDWNFLRSYECCFGWWQNTNRLVTNTRQFHRNFHFHMKKKSDSSDSVSSLPEIYIAPFWLSKSIARVVRDVLSKLAMA